MNDTNPTPVALVTGASSGIGRAIATRLAQDGHHVIATARRADRLADLAAQVPGIEPHPVDVVDRDALVTLVDDVVARHGRIDVAVANAGVMPLSRLDAGLVQEWDRMVDVNVRGLLHTIHAVLGHFTSADRGHFVTTASVGAHEVDATAAVYAGTKHAAWAITEGLRLESSPGIRVTTVSPGVVTSELAAGITDPTARDAMAVYRRHAIAPEAVADAVAYAVGTSPDIDVNEILVRPVRQR